MAGLTLGYWDIRGLAEPARMMLLHGNVKYEDKRYPCGDGPDYDKSSWLGVKFTLGLDFPNLPYLIDGDIKITESQAVYRYIARKVGLVPTDPKTLAECEMLESVIIGFRNKFTHSCYNPKFDEIKPTIKQGALEKLKLFEDFLGEKKFFTGDKLAYVDFQFYETMDHHRTCFPDILEKNPKVKAFMDRFASQDRISVYLKSDRYKSFPINNKMARWIGNKKQEGVKE